MKRNHILTALLVVALVAPAASAATTQVQPQADTPDAAATTGEASSSQSGQAPTNYTRLYVEDNYRSLELKPGEETSFDVTVANEDEEAVTINPHLYVPPVGQQPVKSEWVSFSEDEVTLESGGETTITVDISVPEDADLGNYHGMIAMTDEMISYPGTPQRPVHAATFSVDVYEEPTVSIVDGQHMHTQIQADESYTHSIVIENTGEQAVPVDPTVNRERGYRVPPTETASFERSWMEIDAPSEIPAGETATVTVTVTPPADAAVGDYDVELNLGLKDPARTDQSEYWQQVGLGFQVWDQPEEPFTTSFDVSEETSTLTLKLDAPMGRAASADGASFDVSFVTPNGTTVDAERVSTTNSGHVDLADERAADDGSAYGTHGGDQTFTYRVEDPEAGEWTAEIMPENAIEFGYDIVRDES
ncbi:MULTISPECIES: NEW3 domain-containing protein [Salinibaculum]|uniref:COG1470 family protein n=1 Tax=Salinibaculum TaxID=2732368 RepID=UPI0030D4F34A